MQRLYECKKHLYLKTITIQGYVYIYSYKYVKMIEYVMAIREYLGGGNYGAAVLVLKTYLFKNAHKQLLRYISF